MENVMSARRLLSILQKENNGSKCCNKKVKHCETTTYHLTSHHHFAVEILSFPDGIGSTWLDAHVPVCP